MRGEFPDFDVPYYARPVEPLGSWLWKQATLGFTLLVLWSAFAVSVVIELLWRRGRRR